MFRTVHLTSIAAVNPAEAKKVIVEALARGFRNPAPGGADDHAASELGISRNTLRRLMKKLKVKAPGDRRRWVKSYEKAEKEKKT